MEGNVKNTSMKTNKQTKNQTLLLKKNHYGN